mgnify:CR=1 FL=1
MNQFLKSSIFVFFFFFGIVVGIFVLLNRDDIYEFYRPKKVIVPDATYSLLTEAKNQGLESYSTDDSRRDILAFITGQFDLYRAGGIELKQIEDLYNLPPDLKKHLAVCRVQVINSKVYADFNSEPIQHYCKKLVAGLYRSMKKNKINNVDFIFLAFDVIPAANEEVDLMVTNTPFFLMSKDLASPIEKNALLLPDAYLLENKMWPNVFYKIQRASKNYSWDSKILKVFWRGSTTGGDYKLENYDRLPRLSLVMLSKSFPNLLDARFANFAQFSEEKSSKDLHMVLSTLFPEGPKWVVDEDHLAYKYLISIDGNTCAWLRVPWILLSNSVLLKQESQKIEMFYAGLKPYVHYVPVSEDISDVFEKLRWLQHHDAEAKIISENATSFIQTSLTQDKIDEYLAITLNEYHKLQKFEVTKPTMPPVTEMWLRVMGL